MSPSEAEARGPEEEFRISGIPETQVKYLKDKDSGIPEEKFRGDAEAAPVIFPFV
jgi:hypothetical protein